MQLTLPKLTLLAVLTSAAGEVAFESTPTCTSENAECVQTNENNTTQESLKDEIKQHHGNANSHEPEPFRCNIYMAPSSIPFAGFGIYTMRDVAKGEKVLPYPESPSIPLCNDYANGLDELDWNHVDYLWNGMGLAKFECTEVSESVMAFGSVSRSLSI